MIHEKIIPDERPMNEPTFYTETCPHTINSLQQTLTINNDSFELNNLWKNHETNRNNKTTLTRWRKSLNLETCRSQQICKQLENENAHQTQRGTTDTKANQDPYLTPCEAGAIETRTSQDIVNWPPIWANRRCWLHQLYIMNSY
jgi:hypothetical protein